MQESEIDGIIPPLPTVMMAVMKFDPAGPGASSGSFEGLVAADKGVSAEILRVANSSFYGRSGKVANLRDAITLLGLKAAKNLVIFLTTKGFTAHLKGEFFGRYLKEFPVATALISQDLSRPFGVKPEDAFLAGLFHKVGMTMLAMKHGKIYADVLAQAETGAVLEDLELKLFGVEHRGVGLLVCKKWNLPDTLGKSVMANDTMPGNDPLTAAVVTAAIKARQMVCIPVSEEDVMRVRKFIEQGGRDPSMLDHLDEEYFSNLRNHPYFEQVGT